MADVDDTEEDTAEVVAVEAERRARQIDEKIGEFLAKQSKLHAKHTELLDTDPKSPKLDKIEEASATCGRVIGVLMRQRADLYDRLPIIVDAKGHIDVLAEKLAKDADLIARTKEKLEKVAKTIASAEKTLVRILALLK